MRYLRLAMLAGLFLGCAGVSAETADSGTAERDAKALVQFQCEAIERVYYDPEMGRRLCRQLRAAQRSGELAALPARDRLKRVTALLRETSGDVHFYAGPVVKAAKADTPDADDRAEPETNWNGGITQVRVLPPNVGYIRWDRHLADDVAFARIISALELLEGVDALIFDLTGNPGGDGRASGFVNRHLFADDDYQDLLVKRCTGETEWKRSEVPYNHAPGPKFPQTPVYVMVSEDTGSAAEYFAFIAQQMKRATVLGSTTAGAGNPVTMVSNDAYFAYVPICQIQTRDGASIERQGVVPDVVLRSDDWLAETLEYVLAQ